MDLLALVLAAWRLTSAINREKIGKGIRHVLAGEKPDAVVPNAFTYKDTFLSNLIMCFWCLSVWVSVLCFIVYLINPLFLYPFAVSTVVILLDEKVLK